MTLRRFCAVGECEDVKGGVHAVLGVLAVGCAAYNATAAIMRGGDRRLLANAVVYAALAALEGYQVGRHWRYRRREP